MAEGINRVQILGNLCAEPDLKATSGGQSVLKLRVATNESYLDRNRERKEKVEYHSCVVWGKRAEALAKLLSKGSRVFVEGSLRTSSYEDRQGSKRYKTEIQASNVILCDSRRSGERQQGEHSQEPEAGDDFGFEQSKGDDGWPF